MATTDLATKAALRRAAIRALRAPSVHNTQPWRFVLDDGALAIHADWDRQLRVLDPTGRQLLISCGCALFNTRAAFAAADTPVTVERLADEARDTLVARVVVGTDAAAADDPRLAELERAIDIRQTNRRRFDDEAVPDEVVDQLMAAARAEGAELFAIRREEHRLATARLSQLADQVENADPAYRAELRRWTTDDPNRPDGVPAAAVPHVAGDAGDDVPIRDFDTRGAGSLPGQTHSSVRQCLLLLGTNSDHPAAWLRAGEALERVLLEIAQRGYTASPFTQVIEVPKTRARLRAELGIAMQPHVLLRVGRAPATSLTRRRPLVEILSDNS
jgi:nitroreductase